ncbi:O-antigen ligase family protein [Virgibacillus sp. L01]|uniref:O-antigen ligase family protein n=1 Tax=Virgibacillus sp. L01 TaxID=3457429 RepID=UPI003FD3BF9B
MSIYILFIVAPFAVSGWFQNLMPVIPTTVVFMVVTFLYFALYFLKVKKLTITVFEKNTILLFVIPILLSFLGVFVALFFENNSDYSQYVSGDFTGRMFLIILNVTILLGLLSISTNWSEREIINLIKKYYYGLLIFIIIGVWQFFHFNIGVPFLNIETRNYIHSVQGGGSFLENRLTSLANEPSFLAPLAIDFMIIAFIVSKRPVKMMLLGLFVLIFSYSGGGYLNLIIIAPIFLLGFLKYKGYKLKRKHYAILAMMFLVITIISIYYSGQLVRLFHPVLGRLDTIFDIEESARMFMFVMPFIWVMSNSFLNALVGYGPSSYNYLQLTEYLPSGMPVHATSNNFFADTVYELGYFGFVCYVLIFCRFMIKSFKNLYNNKYYLISLVLSVHLVASSIYRADFMQPRFWIILFIIMMLFRAGERSRTLTSKSISKIR